MHGDFSRLTFRPGKHHTAVLSQQGRLRLDAEDNEHTAIQAYRTRRLTADLLGPHAGPAADLGFALVRTDEGDHPDLTIGPGRYYVDGILCDATRPDGSAWTYLTQPDAFIDPDTDGLPDDGFLVYLRAREVVVNAIEDPDLHEKALGPALPGTTLRLRVAWQVLVATDFDTGGFETIPEAFEAWAQDKRTHHSLASVGVERPGNANDDPCITNPDAAYRGPENQLYRIEVHRGGAAGTATFKWSRDNGSAVYAIGGFESEWVTVTGSTDDKMLPEVEDWVEVVDDTAVRGGEPGPLLQVVDVDFGGRRVRLSAVPADEVGRDPARHPYLRRWDQRAGGRGGPKLSGGAVPIVEDEWIALEQGVQVKFGAEGTYRTGEYWTAAARTLDGDVEWPEADGERVLLPPAGPDEHLAPLTWFRRDRQAQDLRMRFEPISRPV
ncbi:DUF6519 domain-containing protein [Mangrovihabitans endophyticus]|uniref:Uncharacterized protein n=1 Tax=Mangrovihabitans endophyticus TaxID=1751298 RepID=A0A8J3BWL9_9ACTN|nr:DUF6519 domain-containing protein [Mangrovihabitans endophyticus]GGK74615.1 hypothetical protein GCM10012284_05700 [Mangrovihabitans endophyticus]